jgi:hypothetical protein
MLKLGILLLLLLGESLAIYAELFLVKYPQRWLAAWWIITAAGLPLLVAYGLSRRAMDSTWVMAIASIAAIAVVEPLLLWRFLEQQPSPRLMLAMGLCVTGLVLALWK